MGLKMPYVWEPSVASGLRASTYFPSEGHVYLTSPSFTRLWLQLTPPGRWSSIFGKEIRHSFGAMFEKLNGQESMVVRTCRGAQRSVYLKPQVLMGLFLHHVETGASCTTRVVILVCSDHCPPGFNDCFLLCSFCPKYFSQAVFSQLQLSFRSRPQLTTEEWPPTTPFVHIHTSLSLLSVPSLVTWPMTSNSVLLIWIWALWEEGLGCPVQPCIPPPGMHWLPE